MGNNGFVIKELQGTKQDFVGAWIMRLVQTALAGITAASVIWFGKLILASVIYLVNTLPPMQADVRSLKSDVQELKERAATKKELEAAESRVKQEFAEQLKRGITTTKR